MTTTMKAWSNAAYGPASGFRLEQIAIPAPGPGEVLLRVHATALNAGDVRLMLGDPLLVRPIFGMRRPKHPIRGMEVAGRVAALGDGVTDAATGDEVVVELVGGGGLAEYVCAPASRIVARPAGVDPVQAACLPVAAGTAWQALDAARIDSGAAPQRVLVIGASGGVGTFAVQLAALRGAEVWASCGERNRSLVEELGATRVLDHRTSPLADLPAAHFDAVIDIAGGIPLHDLQRLVRDGGRVVLVTGDGGHVLGPIPRMLKAAVRSIGSRRRIRSLAASPKPAVVRELLALAAAGSLRAVIEREYPFAEASAALAHLEAGHTAGKVVVVGTA
ncbi:NAD(P)-dependent alcohol dehydrogenase [Microbacterium galbinum]|uniref:NAD(P)-dependent alcohol dehydrogenase n=1 Tax=Microbacterium galbinum TaxID=2851646 RepID=UPI001FFC70AA|nr:NAD(P)-dependent alcohol dehydrogenase [Microbacterium galbinum]MCK2030600.1 NAD(P)-dependent alcohol dehydrogenase [Microbacterium galbinum]